MSLSKWSLAKIQFLLSHIEDFVEDESADLRKKINAFEIQSGLEKMDTLAAGDPADPARTIHVLENLAPFYEAGLLVQRVPSSETSNWWLTDFFWRGQVFRLELGDQLRVTSVIRQISPLQIQRAPAVKLLVEIGLGFMHVSRTSQAFLFRPTSQVAYILMSDLPELWSTDHVSSTQKLLNKSFIF